MNLVILSRNANLYSTNSLVQAAIKRKHNVRVVNPIGCDLVMEQGVPSIYYRDQKIEHIDAVIPRIGSSITYYGVAVVKQFEMMGVFTTASSLAISQSRDKLKSLQILSQCNIGIPKTTFTHKYRPAEKAIEYIGGAPLILKVLEGTQGIGVMLAENDTTATSIIETLNDVPTSFITQEYIEESKGCDIRILIVNNEVVGAMKRQGKEGEFRSNLHRGGSSEIITLTPEEKNTAIKAVNALDLNIAGVDMLQSKRGPLVLEVNSSPGLEGIETTTRKDIAKEIIKYIEQRISE